jgi:hypothetical protein
MLSPGQAAQAIMAEYDEEGIFFYQAFNEQIADYAIANQKLGGDNFNPMRMTWIKPSFAWVLYRSGYASKSNQTRILKLKVPHVAIASLLSQCDCKHGGGGSNGRVQWDPARDILTADGKVPRKMLRDRAIQIGLKGDLSVEYVNSIISIDDVSALSRSVGKAHGLRRPAEAMALLAKELPDERSYMPQCSKDVLSRLGLVRGVTADFVGSIGLGKANEALGNAIKS